MVVVNATDPTTLVWNQDAPPISKKDAEKTEQYSYTALADYQSIFIEADPEQIDEIGAFVDGECIGATVINDTLEEIKAYIPADATGDITLEYTSEGTKSTTKLAEYTILFPETKVDGVIKARNKDRYYRVSLKNTLGVDENNSGYDNNLQVYPNPSGGPVTFSLSTNQKMKGTLDVYNSTGVHIKQLFKGTIDKGIHTFYLNKAGRLPAGVYLYTLQAGTTIQNGKINSVMMKYLIYITLFFTGLNALQAGIITVAQDGSGDVTSVQEGINLAQANDTVLVMPGTYLENLLIEGKALTLASNYLFSNDPDDIANTIIDGNNQGCVIIAEEILGAFAINGLTIQNGKGIYPNGGGISLIDCENTSIFNSHIHNNTAESGGGINSANSNIYLEGNTICYNHAFAYGGGIFVANSGFVEFSPENRCSIYMNYAASASDIIKIGAVDFSTHYDTLTVDNPSLYYILSRDPYGNIFDDIEIDNQNHKIEKIDADVYVSPEAIIAMPGFRQRRLFPISGMPCYEYKMIPSTGYGFFSSRTYAPSINNEMFPCIANKISGLPVVQSIIPY
ncbi:MAG: T9SS type A sorting domain-containing protein [Bacteroidales bacterium]|nr:T9SS type A sorting domain-containing protein [Bacteroidales bacterium]